MDLTVQNDYPLGHFKTQDMSPTNQSKLSENSQNSSILAKMKNRLVNYNLKVGTKESDHDADVSR